MHQSVYYPSYHGFRTKKVIRHLKMFSQTTLGNGKCPPSLDPWKSKNRAFIIFVIYHEFSQTFFLNKIPDIPGSNLPNALFWNKNNERVESTGSNSYLDPWRVRFTERCSIIFHHYSFWEHQRALHAVLSVIFLQVFSSHYSYLYHGYKFRFFPRPRTWGLVFLARAPARA